MALLEKTDIEVLSQAIDDEEGLYRLRVGQKVHYLTVSTDVFDDDTMCRPYLLIPKLSGLLPDGAWTSMTISRNKQDGTLICAPSTEPLREIETTWHDEHVDVLSLEREERFRSGVHEVQYNNAPAIEKIACFPWQVPQIERETWAYSELAHHHRQHPDEPLIGPRFLAHLKENDGRVVGFLLEKLEGKPACIDDLADCEALLGRLHGGVGLVHGDVNRYNFIVNRAKGHDHGADIRLVDFEHTRAFEEGLAKEELMSLPTELTEETGRGGPARIMTSI